MTRDARGIAERNWRDCGGKGWGRAQGASTRITQPDEGEKDDALEFFDRSPRQSTRSIV